MTAPRRINLGSGKDFRADALNIDISDDWQPDLVADVCRPLPKDGRETFSTRRFGEVVIAHGAFDEIIANDVLEHVRDLVCAMTNYLQLLREGGSFHILVPYDLSYGAWQDPTHVRAFNERSWLYYTDWFWYLGWRTHRFVMDSLEFVPGALGAQMMGEGQPDELIVRTPRAIDAMKVTLRKIALTDEDEQALAQYDASKRPSTG